MDTKYSPRARGNRVDYSEQDQAIKVLSLEYQTLRDEMIMRMSSRFQFLGFTTTAAALLATIVSHSALGFQTWLIVGLATGVFMFGFACFWFLGRHVIYISARIANLEQRINELLPTQPGEPSLLSWESEHQQHGYSRWWRNIHLGPGR
jgi:hypothetical protein